MALSTILGQTCLGMDKPSGLKATIPIDLNAPRGLPEGVGVEIVGQLTNGNPGTYGMIFGYSMPAGKTVDTSRSGSLKSSGKNYDYMYVVAKDDANEKGTNTRYWEVWFNESDVNGNGWSTEVKLLEGGNTYTFVFTKRRTGDGL